MALFRGEPVTVIEKVPAGVLDAVLMVRALTQGTVQGLLVKPALAPAGRPLALMATGSGLPERRTLVIILNPEVPRVTLIFPLATR